MKKYILILSAVMLFSAQVKAQKLVAQVEIPAEPESVSVDENNISGATMVLDSTITEDMKLLIVNDRLYAKGGLIETLVNQTSKEKAENREIQEAKATEAFINALNKAYEDYAMKFIKVDTVYVDKQKIKSQVQKIQGWQQKVLSDPEIKNATTLNVWEQKAKKLDKLLYYQRQLK